MQEAKARTRSCVHAGSSEPSPHANVIRTIISCADQFYSINFSLRTIILFSYSVLKFEWLKFRNIDRAHISRLVSLLVIQINSRCLFLTMGSKLLQVYTGIQLLCVSQVNKYTLSYRFLYGNVHGLVFAKNCPVSLNWSDYIRQVLQPFGSGIIPVGMSDKFVTDQIPCLIEQLFTNMRR